MDRATQIQRTPPRSESLPKVSQGVGNDAGVSLFSPIQHVNSQTVTKIEEGKEDDIIIESSGKNWEKKKTKFVSSVCQTDVSTSLIPSPLGGTKKKKRGGRIEKAEN